ncbi:peptidase [Streptomyces sp. ISL-44]|uniref:trypsin-like serine peptidase n=1 Tax=unclassified Streptomyces TaxID=2593676 RepID=UPI001BECD1CB|nr:MULTISPECIES: peptidase [unclassified Streptomyces]MBT2539455.1 peptidase [Streptomyces sp. ISL-44]MCX5012782.1 peptidase [Streptomyces sp. NBC_00555]UUU40968.1 peptidase [Streptomyces sp. NBC_00162]
MNRHRIAASVLLSAGALIAGVLTAASPSVAADTPASFRQQHTQGFWTAERMRGATPLDVTAAPGAARTPVATTAAPTHIAPTAASASPTAFPQAGGAWTGAGAVVKTSGRVFFTMGDRTASCSGDSVTSANGSTVITAGHCVKYQGAWHTNWVFVPAYNNGSAPYGQWSATKTFATDQWAASEDMNMDVGLAVVAPLNGQTLSQAVGAQGILFNGGYNKKMYSFGFPAAAPYDGTKLVYCSGNSGKDFLLTKDHSLACNMTGGSSGGPWFQDFNESTGLGTQVSVNSFGYTFLPNRMYGPYFGNEAKAAYDKAQTA